MKHLTIMGSHDYIQKVFIPKKGMGFVAQCDIPKHTIVLTDESIISLISHKDDKYTDVNLTVIYLIMMLDDNKIKQFEELTPQSQDAYFSGINIKNSIKNCGNFPSRRFNFPAVNSCRLAAEIISVNFRTRSSNAPSKVGTRISTHHSFYIFTFGNSIPCNRASRVPER